MYIKIKPCYAFDITLMLNISLMKITPGGKAAQSNVMVGDIITAVNGMTIHDLQLTEVMQLIKGSGGDQVHLTLLT